MASRSSGAIRRQLGTLFNLGVISELTDGQLLERFATRGGEPAELAFAALVERHGPMVLRVCRNTLHDPNDVQDAFQATFMVLVQKARSLWVRDSLGPWLHRVAYRVSARARWSALQRQKHERQAAETRPTRVSERGDREDIVALLHEEIDRLPERYRVPVVICDLQGLSQEKAARHLGWPVGTVKSRLAKAREILKGRLSRRGLQTPTGLFITAKGLGGPLRTIEVKLPSTLVESTVRAATTYASGKALVVGAISTRVVLLIEEVLTTMFLTKLKLASVVVLLGVAGATGVLAQQRAGSSAGTTANQSPGPASAGSRRTPGVDAEPAPVPAYIRRSRAMIITRLEAEVAEATARLNRTVERAQSPDDPAIDHASKTLENLQQRLDRIDRVLVDVVETYPTMFDFSGGPSDIAANSQPAAGDSRKHKDSGSQPGTVSPDEAGHAAAKDRAEWAKQMFDKGYVSKSQLDAELANSRKRNARSEAGHSQSDAQKGGQQRATSGSQQLHAAPSWDSWSASQGKQGNPQQNQSPDPRNAGQEQRGKPQPEPNADKQNSSQGQAGNGQSDQSQGQGQAAPF